MNKNDFNKVMNNQCKSPQELKGMGEHLIMSSNNKENGNSEFTGDITCKIKKCNPKTYSFPLEMAICKRGTNGPVIYHQPVDNPNNPEEWVCGNVQKEKQLGDDDFKCPSKEEIEDIFENKLFNKKVNIKKTAESYNSKRK